jgi:YegS/Rv2252/BmrU family lipid kinase
MRAALIFNPYAGSYAALSKQLEAAAQVWIDQGWQVEMQPTRAAGDGVRLARAAAEQGYGLVVAAGGDGTINEVVNGLAGSSTALAALPLGTMNVWARELKLPLQPRAAAEAMRSWQVRSIDLGLADERYFLLMAGIGFDAAIVAAVRSAEKRRLGMLAYVLRGLTLAAKMRGRRTLLILDGKRVHARVLMVVIGNSQLYGGLVRITYRASIDDGMFDVCIMKGDGLGSALVHAFSVLGQRYALNPDLEYYRARTVTITARRALPVQVDGDAIGHTPMTFRIAAGALRALLPSTLPGPLLSNQAHELTAPPAPLADVRIWLRQQWDRLLGDE